MDNASSCDSLAQALGLLLFERYNIHFHADNGRIRCLAHIINLVVQALLSGLEEAEDPDFLDQYFLNKHVPFHFNISDDEELKAMEADEDQESVPNDVEEIDDSDDGLMDAESLSALKKVSFFYFIMYSMLKLIYL